MSPNIPVTREIIDRLGTWLSALAAPFLPLVRVPEKDGAFQWEFGEKRAETLMVGKAVRMVSGIKAALFLADRGFTTECLSLLRMVSDFSQEIIFVAEGLIEGRLMEPQERFIRQYFAPIARTPEEYEESEKEHYVSREELFKAHYRLAAKAKEDPDKLRLNSRFLNYRYDKYVHGVYLTATELYDGFRNSFVLNGHYAEEPKMDARIAVAGKLHGVIVALRMMGMFPDNIRLRQEIGEARRALDASGEY